MRPNRHRTTTLIPTASVATMVIVLAGCGPIGERAADPTDAMTTTTTSTSSGRLSREAAAGRYLELIAETNAIVDTLNIELDRDKPRLPRLQWLEGRLAEAEARFADALRATSWPEGVEPLAEAVADDADTDAVMARKAAAAHDLDSYYRVINSWPIDDGPENRLRRKLGLATAD